MADKNEWLPSFESGIDEGHVAVSAIVVVHALQPDGQNSYYIKYTPGLDDLMALGMLDSAIHTLRAHIQERWKADE